MNLSSKGAVKRVTVEAVIIRADGTREPLGIIADSDNNPNIIRKGVEWLRQLS